MIRSTLPENGNFYRGNLHAHTVSSDGHNSTEELIQFYKDAKYDFLAITDHNIYTDLSDRSTDDFLLIPGAEIGIYKSCACNRKSLRKQLSSRKNFPCRLALSCKAAGADRPHSSKRESRNLCTSHEFRNGYPFFNGS